jgi:hypothetical protein
MKILVHDHSDSPNAGAHKPQHLPKRACAAKEGGCGMALGSTAAEQQAGEASLKAMLARNVAQQQPSAACLGSAGPSLLAIGVLTMPVLIRSPLQRTFHRAVHRAQEPMRAGRICMRYLIADAEVVKISETQRSTLYQENVTYADMLQLPDVPRGPLSRQLPPNGLPGGACVLKILGLAARSQTRLSLARCAAATGTDRRSRALACLPPSAWFQHATRRDARAPYVAYGDDDTYWALARVDQT